MDDRTLKLKDKTQGSLSAQNKERGRSALAGQTKNLPASANDQHLEPSTTLGRASSSVTGSTLDPQTTISKIRLTKEQMRAIQAERRRNRTIAAVAILLVILSLGLVAEVVTKGSQNRTATKNALYQEQLAKRIEQHKQSTGFKINMARTGVEADNYLTVPDLDSRKAIHAPDFDVMAGLNLFPEQHHRESSRDRSEVAYPDFADARVRYVLKEEQERADFVESLEDEQKRYVQDFVRNAKKAGYEVKVKRDLEVEVARNPNGSSRPDSEEDNYLTSPSAGGGAR